jgi:hypothetical protein
MAAPATIPDPPGPPDIPRGPGGVEDAEPVGAEVPDPGGLPAAGGGGRRPRPAVVVTPVVVRPPGRPSVEPELNVDRGEPSAAAEPVPPPGGEPDAGPGPVRPGLHEAMTVVEPRAEVLADGPAPADAGDPPQTLTKPARGNRPALTITFLRPGQASPLA